MTTAVMMPCCLTLLRAAAPFVIRMEDESSSSLPRVRFLRFAASSACRRSATDVLTFRSMHVGRFITKSERSRPQAASRLRPTLFLLAPKILKGLSRTVSFP
eukprot:1724052-Prymnesium_polylepis.1